MFELRKIGFVKRASAWLLDAILLAVLATGFALVISLICNFSHEQELAIQYYSVWEEYRETYIEDVATFYGFSCKVDEYGEYTVTKDGQSASLDDVIQALEDSKGRDRETAEAYEQYQRLQAETPASKVELQYQYVYNLLFMIVSLGILLSYLVLEFILPIILKNGQTVGKKVFGICLVRPDCVKITNISLFARTLLGKFAVETMFPILLIFLFFFAGLGLLAVILLAALFILNAVLLFATKNHTPIHDIFANTVVVDMKLQRIFESEEALVEYKKLQHKEFIENSKS